MTLPAPPPVVEPSGIGLVAAALVVAAPFLGGFAATIVVNWREPGRGVTALRSRCTGCGRRLGPLDLLPLVSWIRARGRCSACGVGIDRLHPALELCFPLVAAVSLWLAPTIGAAAAGCCLGWTATLLAALDARHRLLPHAVTGPLLVAGLAMAWAGMSVTPLEAIVGALLGFSVLSAVAFFYRRLRGHDGIGGGDIRLLAAAGSWLGAAQLPLVLVIGGSAALAAAGLSALRGAPVGAATAMPFGAYLAPALWVVWLLRQGAV
jgi:leader peptidase (prepilin peptidase) / N-methyltransferase